MVTSSQVGTNADLIPNIVGMYVAEGSTVADVTYGKGVFWQKVDVSKYNFLPTDLLTGVDFTALPYEDGTIDCVVFDPPYMHGGQTVLQSLKDRYRNDNGSHESVIRLYARGILEATRVLKKKGRIIVKCQDETESGKQRLTHVEIIELLKLFGFIILDTFVLVQSTTPCLQVKEQKSARKNHSYALVAEFRR
jgi:hypothetical protein